MNSSMLTNHQDETNWSVHGKDTFFLGNDSIRIIYIMVSYLAFVYVIGPLLMQNRQPFVLKSIVRLFNIINICNNVILFIWVLKMTDNLTIYLSCKAVGPIPDGSHMFMEMYLWSRLFDLTDTILLVLRKKHKQITKLHIFHHTLVPTAIYACCHVSMSRFIGFCFIVNIVVHIFMYTYYTMASYPSMAPYMGIKKYITKLQLAQFALNTIFYSVGYPYYSRCKDASINTFNFAVVLTANIIFLISFSNFYMSSYRRNSKNKIKSN